ncbi:hypothetical protein L211DRAFT_870429 [Terfezia boudieri ATCC MYA-4762]|uniref:Uncharacterized protein n=1 Tax=Terfezia boudieri ATCC MYA-4762 TaxID=1051890 RepID=A0A3N4LCT3_9PEZI|nr:hypothetical protein L211DRAFT_870429 [Terfezia boudieri ATCC MYA-4762]
MWVILHGEQHYQPYVPNRKSVFWKELDPSQFSKRTPSVLLKLKSKDTSLPNGRWLYWPTFVFTPSSSFSSYSYRLLRMAHSSSVQPKDTGKSSQSAMIYVIDTPPPDYDSIETKDGEKRAPTLGAPVDQIIYHGPDVDNLLGSSRSAIDRVLEGVDVHFISSSRSFLNMTGDVPGEFSSSGSEDGGEEGKEKDYKEQEKGIKAKREKLKGVIKGETEDVVDANEVEAVEGNLDGFSEVPSTSVSYMNAEGENFTSLDPEHFSISVSTPLKTSGTFTSPDERLLFRESNLTQAMLELHREAAIVTSAEAPVNTGVADEEGPTEEKQPNIHPWPLYQVDSIAGFMPPEARATTAMTYTDMHSAEICKPKIDVIKLLWRLLLPPEAKDPSTVPVSPIDLDFRGLLRGHDPPSERFYRHTKRRRAISTRTVSSTGVETHHLWRDDLSFLSIDNVLEDPISPLENHSVPPNAGLSPLKVYSPLDGQVDGPRDRGLELLFYPDTASPEPPAEGLYCNECQNGKGKCFCYYELRVEKCSICTKGREFCECWPTERLRDSYIRRPLDPTGAREGRRARSGTYVGEVGLAGLGLRIGGVALRGGVDDSWRPKAKGKERGRQRQRESERLMTPLVAPSVETFASSPKVFGSPPKVSSPLKFEFGDEDDALDGDLADVKPSPPTAASGGVFLRERSVHKVEERDSRDTLASDSRRVSPPIEHMQEAWMCVCGRCGGMVVCSLAL